MKKLRAALAVGLLGGCSLAVWGQTGNGFYDPAGGWGYVYHGDRADGVGQPGGAALDGTWRNDVTSDEWDGLGRGVGVGAVGGVSVRDGVLTIEDASTEAFAPNSKLYFLHEVSQESILDDGWLDAGVTLYFRARLTPPTDAALELAPAPNGYGIFNGGKGMVSLRQAGPTGGTSEGIVSFSLVNAIEDASPAAQLEFPQAGLTMNRLNGDEATSAVDSASSGELNLVPLDPSEFHEFWIVMQGNGDLPGTHRAIIYVDGVATQNYVFDLTAGTGDEGSAFSNYLGLGAPTTLAVGSLDIDYLAYRAGAFAPVPIPEPSVWLLFGVGGIILGWVGRRR